MKATQQQILKAKELGFHYENYKQGGEYFLKGALRIWESDNGKYWISAFCNKGHYSDYENSTNLDLLLARTI